MYMYVSMYVCIYIYVLCYKTHNLFIFIYLFNSNHTQPEQVEESYKKYAKVIYLYHMIYIDNHMIYVSDHMILLIL